MQGTVVVEAHKKLVNIESNLENIGGLPTMTPEKIRKIGEQLVEVDKATQTLGRSKTQTQQQLQTLTMIASSPYRRIRQCLAQIEDRRRALEDTYFKHKENAIRIKELEEKGDEASLLEVEKILYKQERAKQYIDGAFKELGTYISAMEEIKKAHNIPDDYTQEMVEKEEPRHHLRQAFMQSYRDMMMHGKISQGNAEYLTSYGVHLSVGKRFLEQYIAECEKLIDDGHLPTIEHLYVFLDRMVDMFFDAHKMVAKDIGIDSIIKNEYLYLGEGNGDN